MVQTFVLQNNNNEALAFHIDASTFEFTPKSGMIAAKSKHVISVSYTPQEAIVQVATAVVQIENEEQTVIKLSAIGKYPYLSLSNKKLDFD